MCTTGPGLARFPRRRSGGFSIVEVLVATLVLTVGISGAAASIVSAMALTRTNTETALAQQSARRMLEQVRGMDFATAFAVLSVAPGKDFAVAGLRPLPGDPDGFVGEVLFPTVLDAGVLELREDVADPAWGMPRDLDGSGAVDMGLDVAGTYVLLPIRVRVQWQSPAGPRTLDVLGMLGAP